MTGRSEMRPIQSWWHATASQAQVHNTISSFIQTVSNCCKFYANFSQMYDDGLMRHAFISITFDVRFIFDHPDHISSCQRWRRTEEDSLHVGTSRMWISNTSSVINQVPLHRKLLLLVSQIWIITVDST